MTSRARGLAVSALIGSVLGQQAVYHEIRRHPGKPEECGEMYCADARRIADEGREELDRMIREIALVQAGRQMARRH